MGMQLKEGCNAQHLYAFLPRAAGPARRWLPVQTAEPSLTLWLQILRDLYSVGKYLHCSPLRILQILRCVAVAKSNKWFDVCQFLFSGIFLNLLGFSSRPVLFSLFMPLWCLILLKDLLSRALEIWAQSCLFGSENFTSEFLWAVEYHLIQFHS